MGGGKGSGECLEEARTEANRVGGQSCCRGVEMASVAMSLQARSKAAPGLEGREEGEQLQPTVLPPQVHAPPQPAALKRQLLMALADQAGVLG